MTADEKVELAARRMQERRRAIADARERFAGLAESDRLSVLEGFSDAERAAQVLVRRNNDTAHSPVAPQ